MAMLPSSLTRAEKEREYSRIWQRSAKRKEYARLYAIAWRKKNAEHFRAYMKEYRERNPEKIAQNRQLDYKRHKAHIDAKSSAWRRAHPARCSEYRKKWAVANPGKMRLIYGNKSARRRALKISAALPGHELEISAIFRECAAISISTGVRHSVDHIWPLNGPTATGLHVPWNLRIIPLSENIRKRNSEPIQCP
jgi:hypothetical protein